MTSSAFWTVPGEFEVYVLQTSAQNSGATVVVKPYETDRLGSRHRDIKLDKRGDTTEAILPVPKLAVSASDNIMAQQASQLFDNLKEFNFTNIAIDIDAVYSWRPESFAHVMFLAFKRFCGQVKIFRRVTFCTRFVGAFNTISSHLEGSLGRVPTNSSDLQVTSQQPSTTTRTSKPKVKITVRAGLLDETKADVLACTTTPNLDLSQAVTSRALLHKGGRELQKNLDKWYPNGINFEEIAVIDGTKELQCKHVFFGVLESYQDYHSHSITQTKDKFFRSRVDGFVKNCLKRAEEKKCTTIAFPAVGSGGLGYPVDIVADQMFTSVLEYQSFGQIQDVTFVIYTLDTKAFQVFKDCEMAIFTAGNQAGYREGATGGNTVGAVSTATMQAQLKPQMNSPATSTDTIKIPLSELAYSNVLFFYADEMTQFAKRGCTTRYLDGNFEITGPNMVVVQEMKEVIVRVLKRVNSELIGDTISMTEEDYKQVQSIVGDVCSKYGIHIIFDVSFIRLFGNKMEDVKEAKKAIQETLKGLDKTTVLLRASGSTVGPVRKKDTIATQSKLSGDFDKDMTIATTSVLNKSSQAHKTVLEVKNKPYDSSKYSDNGNIPAADPSDKGARPKNVSTPPFSWTSETKSNAVFHTKEHVVVKVYCCDILRTPVDCIVNAANESLSHISGIAHAISKAAGKDLERDGKEYLKKHKCLPVGGACRTGAGKLQYKCVIHAVGPCWDQYKPHSSEEVGQCEKDIYAAVMSSLTLAEQEGMSTIALPTISSGIYSCPKEMCCVQYGLAIVNYSALSKSPLSEIHFVDTNESMVKMMHGYFNKIIEKGQEKDLYNKAMYLKGGKDVKPTGRDKPSSKSDNKGASNSRNATVPSSLDKKHENLVCYLSRPPGHFKEEFTVCFGQGQVLYIYADDLLSLRNIDMLVFNEIPSGNDGGVLAKAVKQRCGKDYEKEKNEQFRLIKPKSGDTIVCRGGNRNFKWIVHVILYLKKDAKNEKERKHNVKKIYGQIIDHMRMKDSKTVALPSLGSGKGGADPAFYTECFLEEIIDKCDYLKAWQFEIHLVNKKDVNTQAAIDVIKKITKQAVPQEPSGFRRQSPHIANSVKNRRPASASDVRHNTKSTGRGNGKDLAKSVYASSSRNSGEATGYRNRGNGHQSKKPPGSWDSHPDSGIDSTRASGTHETSHGSSDQTGQRGDWSSSSDSDDEKRSIGDENDITDPPGDEDETCVICMDTLKKPKRLRCGHVFCQECIEAQFVYKEACPTCGTVLGVIEGDQPYGTIDVRTNHRDHCVGFEDNGRIEITYSFRDGTQGPSHPNPGHWYKGIKRTAYLPSNRQGKEICEMLKVAFDRKLVFTIGSSRTTGKEGVITWNDIHHKTDPKPNSQFGYPDPTYLDRVTDELKAKGVTAADIPTLSSPSRNKRR